MEPNLEQSGRAHTPRHRHEERDATMHTVAMLGLTFIVLTVAGGLVSLAVFRYFSAHQPLGPPASPFEKVRTVPPAPRLQVAPAQDLQGYLQTEQAVLNSYGWVDQQAGIVRIPIDRAMEVLLQKGLPVRSGSQPANQLQASCPAAEHSSEHIEGQPAALRAEDASQR